MDVEALPARNFAVLLRSLLFAVYLACLFFAEIYLTSLRCRLHRSKAEK